MWGFTKGLNKISIKNNPPFPGRGFRPPFKKKPPYSPLIFWISQLFVKKDIKPLHSVGYEFPPGMSFATNAPLFNP